jgi:hypothetical protein
MIELMGLLMLVLLFAGAALAFMESPENMPQDVRDHLAEEEAILRERDAELYNLWFWDVFHDDEGQ